eukprot:778339-Prymnesium_polylepis.1
MRLAGGGAAREELDERVDHRQCVRRRRLPLARRDLSRALAAVAAVAVAAVAVRGLLHPKLAAH